MSPFLSFLLHFCGFIASFRFFSVRLFYFTFFSFIIFYYMSVEKWKYSTTANSNKYTIKKMDEWTEAREHWTLRWKLNNKQEWNKKKEKLMDSETDKRKTKSENRTSWLSIPFFQSNLNNSKWTGQFAIQFTRTNSINIYLFFWWMCMTMSVCIFVPDRNRRSAGNRNHDVKDRKRTDNLTTF